MKKITAVVTAALAIAAYAGAVENAPKPAASSASSIITLINSRATNNLLEYKTAAEAVAADAAAGKPLQQFLVAVFSRDPNAPAPLKITAEQREKYLADSREKIRTLATQRGNPLAWYILSLEDNDRSMLKRAADGRNVQAMNTYGTLILNSALANLHFSTQQKAEAAKEAFNYFKLAADQGDANGYYNIAMCYMQGYGTQEDPKKAYDLFHKAASMGHSEAVNNIGGFFRDGIVVDRDLAVAAKWFKRSADMRNVYGMLNYALALLRGEGVAKDVETAARLLGEAARYNAPEAMNNYGMCLMNGEGVEKDEAAGFAWLQRSAAGGYAPAMENIASCYDTGRGGVNPDQKAALVWKIRARCARGDKNAAAWLQQNGYSVR